MNQSNTASEREFFDAIQQGQMDTVGQLVANHPELLAACDYNLFGATPVTAVCFKDDREMLK